MIFIGVISFTSFQNNISETSPNPTSGVTKNTSKPNEEFQNLEYNLLNQDVFVSILDSIKSIKNDFEKDYLLSLLKKRKADYQEAFELLFKHLSEKPNYFPYYEEIVLTAKATDNIQKLDTFVSKSQNRDNFVNYLNALLAYHSNNYSLTIEYLKDEKQFDQLYQLSFAYRGLGDYEKSLAVLMECKNLIDSTNRNYVKVLVAEGSLYLLSGDWNEAERIYLNALQLSMRFRNKKEEAKSLINLAIVEDSYGLTSEAQSKLFKALELAKIIENQDLEATTLSELGVSLTYSNKILKARDNYEKSLNIYRILNNKERLANLSANIAAIFVQQGNYLYAMKNYEYGLRVAGENVVSKILNLRGLGDVYCNLSNYSCALDYYSQAKTLAKQIKKLDLEISLDASIGTLFYNINKPNNAIEMFSNGIQKSKDGGDIYLTEDLKFKLGLSLASIKKYKESDEYFNEALNIAKSVDDIYYQLLINTEQAYNYFLSGDYSRAENLFSHLILKSKKQSITQLLCVQYLYLGQLYSKISSTKKALDNYSEAFKYAIQIKDFNTLISAKFGLGQCYELLDNTSEAEKNYKEAINYIETVSDVMISSTEIQISHFSGFNEPYNALIELYLRQQREPEALEILEESRSRNTQQNLFFMKIATTIKDDKKIKKYFDLKWELESGLNSKDKLKDINSEMSSLLEENNLRINNATNNFNLKAEQNLLRQDEYLLSFFVGKSNSYSFVINNKNLLTHRIDATSDDIKKIIANISPIYSDNNSDKNSFVNQDLFSFNAEAANHLYRLVFKDALKDIPSNSKLIFSLPSELLLVPIELLVTEYESSDSPYLYNNKKYLIDKYAVSYTPSLSIYKLLNEKSESPNKLALLVGDPIFNNKEIISNYRSGLLSDGDMDNRNITLYPLKYSKVEIENISELFSEKSVLTSNEATESNFKEKARISKIIHLSTHSFLLKNQPLIIFSKSSTTDTFDDGYLEPSELYNLKINSDLVVLSSCRSGVGIIDKSEGILGMQKSFFDAGAKSVVVSMWDVNDKYTSLFMKNFYEQLNKGLSKSEALRKTKLEFKEKYSANPYYWAAFTVSGNNVPVEFSKSNSHFIILTILAVFLLLTSIIIYIKINRH